MSLWTKKATLDFPSIPSQESADLTIDVPAAKVGDSVSIGLPSNIVDDVAPVAFILNDGVVTVRIINATAGAIDPIEGEFTVSGDR